MIAPRRRVRAVVSRLSLTLAVLAFAWAVFLFFGGGLDLRLLGVRVSTNDFTRPLLIASVALTVFIFAGGGVRGLYDWMTLLPRVRPTTVALALAATATLVGLAFGTTAASGADAYGYVSQAELWLRGELRVDHDFVREVPWPSKIWSFAPLGYRPFADTDPWAIVPTYSPGLPLLMAAAKLIAGHCGLFAVVPISGGLLVLATFGIGRRLAGDWAGVIGAWLVATSPVFLFMLMWPMTDVPVAAAWAGAFFFALGTRRRDVVAAGLCASVAILIRPNLAYGAAFIGIWFLMRRGSVRRRLLDATVFSLGVLPGVTFIAILNAYLYGSPLASGYGGLGGMFGTANVLPNLERYVAWFIESQTIVPLIAVVGLVWPARRFWPAAEDRRVVWILLAFVLSLLTQYLFYLVFDAWWYLRFLLACWPFAMVSFGAMVVAGVRRADRGLAVVAAIVVVALGAINLHFAWTRSAFELWEGERRYVSAGRLVRASTDPNSVIFTMQHSGSVRYYGGRLSIRYDNLEPQWLDRAVEWLQARGVRSYLLLEDWEEPSFRAQFAGQRRVAHLDAAPILNYEGPAKIALYDLTFARQPGSPRQLIVETFRDTHCVPPAPPPTLSLK